MSDLVVKCERCGNLLTHECNTDLRQAIIDLMCFTPHYGMPEFLIKASKKAGLYDKEDDYVPFISETFLYPLLGKDDARTFMALLSHVLRSAGIDPHSADLNRDVNDVLNSRMERRRFAAYDAARQKAYDEAQKAEAANKAKKRKK